MRNWGERGWMVAAGVAGAVLVGMVGAPVSVDSIFLVGPDRPEVIGEQFGVLFAGTGATAGAILLAHRWRWLLAIGSIAMVVGHVIRVPRAQGVSVRVVGDGRKEPVPDIVAHPVWVALLVAASAVLLVGVLALAQELLRDNRVGACLAGFAGCAGYFGVSVVGRLRATDQPVRLIVVLVAAALAVIAVIRLRENGIVQPRGLYAGAGAALVWLLPTMIVAIRNQAVFGTVTGGVVGLVVLAVALLAARPAGVAAVLAVAATGLMSGSMVGMLALLYDVPFSGVWYGWPIAIAGVLAGSGAAAGPLAVRGGIVAAAGLSMIGLVENRGSTLIIWVFLALSMAAVAVTVGSAARVLSRIGAAPALVGLGTLAGLGVFGSLNLARVGARPLGSTVEWISALLVLGAAGLLVATSVARSDRSATRRWQQSR